MFRNPALLTLWGGELASRAGESAFQLALLWYLLEETGSSLNTGLVTMISFLPALLVGVWSGVLVDRWEFRRVLLGANLLRALLALSLPLLFLAQALPIWLVGLLAFLLNSASAFFNPARDAIIPQLSPPGDLVAANSLVQSAWQFSLLLGPFLAAAALPFVPTVFLFALVALAFLISMGVLLRLPRLTRVEPSGGGQGAWTAFTVEFRTGLETLWQDRRVFWIWAITVVNNFFLMGAVIVGMPYYVKNHLGGTGTDFALVEGTYAGGMIIATWIIGRYGGRIEPLRLLFLGMVYDGLTYLPLLWVHSLGGVMLTVFVHSLGIPAITISRLTALHRIVPAHVQGRIFSYFNMAVNGMTALSIGVVGLVLIWLPANQLFAVIGLLAAACGVCGLLLPVFRRG